MFIGWVSLGVAPEDLQDGVDQWWEAGADLGEPPEVVREADSHQADQVC